MSNTTITEVHPMPVHLSTTTPATPRPVAGPTDCYHRATALGVKFGPGTGKLGYRFPAEVSLTDTREVEMIGRYLRLHTSAVLKVASNNPAPLASHHPSATGLQTAPKPPPQRIGYDRHGHPLPDVDAPAAEPTPEPPPPWRHMRDVGLLTEAELRQEVRSIEQEAGIITDTMTGLGDEVEGEELEVTQERDRQTNRRFFLARRLMAVEAEQSRRLFERIDQVEQERMRAAGPKLKVNW